MIPISDDNPTRTTPYVTVALIAVTVLAFLWQVSHDPRGQELIVFSLGLIPAVLLTEQQLQPEFVMLPAELTVVTSMFLHGGWLHLIGNMLYLWIFGNNVEDAMGHGRFLLFYLLCGSAAALSQALPNPESLIPMIGASGAIAGVLGAYLLLHPYARVTVLVPLGFIFWTVYLPAVTVLGLWFALQILSSLAADPQQGGVAWFAHIGGFVAGVLLIPLFKKRGVRFWAPPRRR